MLVIGLMSGTSADGVDAAGAHAGPVITEISPAGTFWPADDYHQDYYRQNRDQPRKDPRRKQIYCFSGSFCTCC